MTMPPPAPVATGRSAARSPGAGGAPRAATAEAVVISTQPGSPAEPTTFVRDVPAHDAAAPGRRSRTGALVVAVVAGVVLAGGGFAAWRWREALLALVGAGDGADGSAKGTDKGEGGDGRGKGDAKGKGGGGVDGDGRSGDPGSAASGSAAPGEPGGGAVAAGDPSDRAAITALLAEGRAAEALARLSTAGVKDPGTRGLALAAAGKPGEAIPLLAEALGAKGDDAAVAIALVGAYLSAGDAARAATTAAALPAPLRDQANGLVAFARGDLKRAVKLLRKTARAGAPWAQTTLALALLASGDSGAALEVLGPARKAAPAAVDLAAAEALALARAGKTGAARKAAAALAARTPPITSGSSLRMVADALLAAGDSKGALDMAERAAATTPADVAALLTLGRAAAAAGDTAKAAEAYGRAAKAAPEDAAVLAGWARALLARGDADGAAAAAAKAYTLAPAMIEAQLAQCEALVAGGKAAAATKMLKTLLKDARGGDDEAAVQLVAGKAYAARGKKGVAKALDAYARALELRESAEGHYLTGQALELKGAAGKKKAAAAYARAVALDDHYAPAHLALGLLLARGKKPPPAARASLEAYLALDPAGAGAADARAALAKLPK
jgi:thioredoxin-like negative regulator of GroEL